MGRSRKESWQAKHYILDQNNHVIEVDLITWAQWLENPDNRRVGYTEITRNPLVYVSTVFLGLDHGFGHAGPPILYETLVFGGPLDGEGTRYSSWDDAETGHKTFVSKARRAAGQRVSEQT